MGKNKKVILAFSGGLDTSFCVLWLKKQGYSVITVTVDTGGFSQEEVEDIKKQSDKLGSLKHYFIDARKEFYDKIVSHIIKGNILRGGVYPLCAGAERLLVAQKTIEVAVEENATAIAHGSTGAGNDQVRFDVTINALAPKFQIIAPIRQLAVSREEEIKLLAENHIPIPKISKSYSINRGMLGVTVGGMETKNSWESPPEDVYLSVTPLSETPNQPENLIISFQSGLPQKMNGKKMTGVEIMTCLAAIGGKHGVGKGIHLGDTILGIKGRVAFAAPAVCILIRAHKELEKLVLTKWQLFWKNHLADVYGNFLHEAMYFDPVMRDIETFVDSSQERVTGHVKVKLFKGNIIIEGVKSPYSLMNPEIAVYGEENAFWTGDEAAGFSKLYGLQSVLAHQIGKKKIK